jgi:hypothetical protein
MKPALCLCLVLATAAAAPPDRAVLTADLLAQADVAAASPKTARKELARTLAQLDRLGVRGDPADEGDGGAALADWRSRAGRTDPPMRGRVLGPAFRRGWLEAGATMKVDQLFLAGQNASVAVSGTPGQAVKLAVEGPDAPADCTGRDRTCRWTPIFTQRYTITVRNNGQAATRYYLVMD